MDTGIPCPACGSDSSDVVDSRPTHGAFRRRRQCGCGARFTTYEMVDEAQPSQRSVMRQRIAEMSNEEVLALATILEQVDVLLKACGAPTYPRFQRMARRRPVPAEKVEA